MDSDIFKPVFADVLKEPQKLLSFANYVRPWSFSESPSKRSTLFSTKRHGNLSPSKNRAASSTAAFHLRVLYYGK